MYFKSKFQHLCINVITEYFIQINKSLFCARFNNISIVFQDQMCNIMKKYLLLFSHTKMTGVYLLFLPECQMIKESDRHGSYIYCK